MNVLFVGTSGSTFHRGNMPPSILVENRLLFDCPAPCPYELSRRKLLERLEAVFLTHLHADHALGVLDLAWHAWIAGLEPFTVILPRGAGSELKSLLARLHPSKSGELLAHLEILEAGAGEEVYGVEAVPARHGVPALGYRTGGFCYTGDTSPVKEHVEYFRGCSLLVHEATYPPGMEREAVADGHSTPLQAAETAVAAGARRLALIHIPTARLGWEARDRYVRAARSIFKETYAPLPGDEAEI